MPSKLQNWQRWWCFHYQRCRIPLHRIIDLSIRARWTHKSISATRIVTGAPALVNRPSCWRINLGQRSYVSILNYCTGTRVKDSHLHPLVPSCPVSSTPDLILVASPLSSCIFTPFKRCMRHMHPDAFALGRNLRPVRHMTPYLQLLSRRVPIPTLLSRAAAAPSVRFTAPNLRAVSQPPPQRP